MAFTQKKCWHSHMRNHSPLVVRFKTSVLTSQYLKDENLRIIYFDAAGPDPHDPDRMLVDTLEGKYYVIDDPGVRDVLEKVQGDTWLVMTAMGGKDEPASIKLEPYTGPTPLWQVNGEWTDKAVRDAEVAADKIAHRPATNGRQSTISPALMAQNYAKPNVEDTYYECLSLAYAMQERFEAMYEREMTFMDLELAQHLFAHWAIKGFDRPLYDGMQPETPPEPEVVMAHEEHINVIRDLAKLGAGTNPALLDSIEEKIAAGLTEEEAKAIIRDLTIA